MEPRSLSEFAFSRRQTIAGLAAGAAFSVLPGCARTLGSAPGAASEAEATALLESIGKNLLQHTPEQATTLGIDKGEHAALRSLLADRSRGGQQRIASTLKSDIARIQMMDTSGFSPATRTSIEVVRAAYKIALEGFALPYGDVAVGGWRNTPYVVIQNVGA